MDRPGRKSIPDSLNARNIFETEAAVKSTAAPVKRGLSSGGHSNISWKSMGTAPDRGSAGAFWQGRYDMIKALATSRDSRDICMALSSYLPSLIRFDMGSLRWRSPGTTMERDSYGTHGEELSENQEFAAGMGLFNSMDDLDLETLDDSTMYNSRNRLDHLHRGRTEDGRILSFEIGSTLVIPLTNGDDQVGTISLYSARSDGFRDADQDLIRDIGHTAGNVLGRMLDVESTNSDIIRQRSLSDSCRDLIVTWRDTGTGWEVDFNSKVEEYISTIDLDPEILSGPFFVPPGDYLDRANDAWSHTHDTGEETMVNLELQDRRGAGKPILCIFSPLIEEGKLLGVRMTGVEVEDLNRTITDLERMNNSYRLMLSVLSHDLKNPLTTIMGYSEILHMQVEDGKKEYLEKIVRMTRRMSDTISLTKLFAQIREGKVAREFVEIDLAEMINGSIDTLYPRTSGHDIRFDLKKGRSRILGLPLLEQVFQNLIDNAMKYSPEGSKVHIHLDTDLAGVTISIEDQGNGVPKEDHESIFNRFTRGNGQNAVIGTGLGLDISRGIIELHNGRIWVEPNRPRGSVFKVYLPWDPDS